MVTVGHWSGGGGGLGCVFVGKEVGMGWGERQYCQFAFSGCDKRLNAITNTAFSAETANRKQVESKTKHYKCYRYVVCAVSDVNLGRLYIGMTVEGCLNDG